LFSQEGCTFGYIDSAFLHCYCNHTTIFSNTFIVGDVVEENEFSESINVDDKYTQYVKDGGDILLSELLVDYDSYTDAVKELYQHKQPSMVGFFVKPGFFVVFILWFFYLTGLTYYGGRDKKRRYNMTK
jgi:hypothetical protein